MRKCLSGYLPAFSRQFHLVGISMGGMISLEMASQAASRLQSLLLVNTHADATARACLNGRRSAIASSSSLRNTQQHVMLPHPHRTL